MKERSYILESEIFMKILIAQRFSFQLKQVGIFQCEAIFTWPLIVYFWCQNVLFLGVATFTFWVKCFTLLVTENFFCSKVLIPSSQNETQERKWLFLGWFFSWLGCLYTLCVFSWKREERGSVHPVLLLVLNIPLTFTVMYFLGKSFWGNDTSGQIFSTIHFSWLPVHCTQEFDYMERLMDLELVNQLHRGY